MDYKIVIKGDRVIMVIELYENTLEYTAANPNTSITEVITSDLNEVLASLNSQGVDTLVLTDFISQINI